MTEALPALDILVDFESDEALAAAAREAPADFGAASALPALLVRRSEMDRCARSRAVS